MSEASLHLEGTSLVHNDVRSDNVCFRGDRVVLVDWSDARHGAGGFDLANLLQTLPLSLWFHRHCHNPSAHTPGGGSLSANIKEKGSRVIIMGRLRSLTSP